MVKAFIFKYKGFSGFSVQVKLFTVYFVDFFLDTKFLLSVTLEKWYACSAHYSGSFLVDTHYLIWNFICSYAYTRSGVMALSSGHLFYDLRVLVEFSAISFALMLATLATY